jgi:hypothetical protein
MRRSKAKLSEGSRAVEDERTSEAKWPQGAAKEGTAFGAHEPPLRPDNRAKRERIPTDMAHRRVPIEGRDPENTTPPITMRSDLLCVARTI